METSKTIVVPRKGNNKPYLCEVCYKTSPDTEGYRQQLARQLNIQERKETLLEISQRERVVTDNWLSFWVNQYYNGK